MHFQLRYSKKFNDDPLGYLFALTANLDGIYCRQTGFPPLLSWQFEQRCVLIKYCPVETFYLIILDPDLKVKPFGVLLSNDIVVSIKSLLTEKKMSSDNKMANGLSLNYNIVARRTMFQLALLNWQGRPSLIETILRNPIRQ